MPITISEALRLRGRFDPLLPGVPVPGAGILARRAGGFCDDEEAKGSSFVDLSSAADFDFCIADFDFEVVVDVPSVLRLDTDALMRSFPFPFISFRSSFFFFAAASAFSFAALLSCAESKRESAEEVLERREDDFVLLSPKLSTGIEVVRRSLLAKSDSVAYYQTLGVLWDIRDAHLVAWDRLDEVS